MAITSLIKEKKSVIGIDSSSTGVAWTFLRDGLMVEQGKIKLDKISGIDAKLGEVYAEAHKLFGELSPDHVFIEKSIFVKNPATARTLSYVVGSIMCIAAGNNIPVDDIEPATWKSALGYKNLSSRFVAEVNAKIGRTDGKKLCDRLRKSQTWRVIKHNFPEQAEGSLAENDHDISDSWGIALVGYMRLGGVVELEKSKDISVDVAELAKLGLSF